MSAMALSTKATAPMMAANVADLRRATHPARCGSFWRLQSACARLRAMRANTIDTVLSNTPPMISDTNAII